MTKSHHAEITPDQVMKDAEECGIVLIKDSKFGKKDYVSVQCSWPSLLSFARLTQRWRHQKLRLTIEKYVEPTLDKTTFQTIVEAQVGHRTFQYTNDVRLWSTKNIEEIREREKRAARHFIMKMIERELFGGSFDNLSGDANV